MPDVLKALLVAAGLVCVYGYCSRAPKGYSTSEWLRAMRKLGIGVK